MNTGPIAHRYAKALLKLVQETGAGEKVYSQACVLVLRMQEIRQLADVIQKHPEVGQDRKMEILQAAVGEPLADELVRFVKLVCENGRIELFERIMTSFQDQYRASYGIKVGRLVTACPAPQLKDTLEALMQEKTGARVLLQESVNEDLIGGFVLQVEDLQMDASVQTQLRRLHNELVDKANRIV
jgi:F-type H+-transporting ATPase subunit delta